MLIQRKPKDPSKVDEAITRVLSEMETEHPTTDKYATMADQLDKLYKAKSYIKENFVSKDTLILVGANLVGIVLILSFEKANIISSKALSSILKPRV